MIIMDDNTAAITLLVRIIIIRIITVRMVLSHHQSSSSVIILGHIEEMKTMQDVAEDTSIAKRKKINTVYIYIYIYIYYSKYNESGNQRCVINYSTIILLL